jgi:hypothetical protein
MPSTTRYQYPASDGPLARSDQSPAGSWHGLRHPLIAICAVQTALSLVLVWSNTAFSDEAQYLSTGQLEWAHWLHGTAVPPYAIRFAGSPVIYPPLGALANDLSGLAGARILSLIFMLGATIFLYLAVRRLFGRTAGVAATAIWALSEPAIRLAFATFDPLSVLFTALSACIVVQVGYRRYPSLLVVAAAAAIALANATAYSGVVVDPIVMAFAFLVWLPRTGMKRASLYTVLFAGVLIVAFGLFIFASGSWTGLSSILNSSSPDQQSALIVLNDSWIYSGLIAVLAVIGAIIAFAADSRQNACLLALLGCAALIVPAAQFGEQTASSLDKHLAYGIWFGAIAAGYACSMLIRQLPGSKRQLAVPCFVIALIYPAASSWSAAWSVYHSWPDAQSFITSFTPVVAQSQGFVDVSETGPQNVAEYYTSQGRQWTRWRSSALPLDPAAVQRSAWESYYARQLRSADYGVIVLFYGTKFSSAPQLPGTLLLSPSSSTTRQALLELVGDNAGEPGLSALTLALEQDQGYRLVTVGPYDSASDYSLYAIWQKRDQA